MSVAPMAGIVRRVSMPAVTPSANEDRVPDRHKTSFTEISSCEPCRIECVERARPPRDHEAYQSGDCSGGEANQGELDGEPVRTGDALGPCQAKRSCLERATSGAPQKTPTKRGSTSTRTDAPSCNP